MLFMSPFLTVYLTVLTFVLGTVFGSFFNCMAWRMAHGENVLKGRSHCTSCGHVLGLLDLVPVLSWLLLKGRCRYCGEKVSPRYLFAEIFLGGVFVSLLYRYDVSLELFEMLVFVSVLFLLSFVDLEIYEIPDSCHVVLIGFWILMSLLRHMPVSYWISGAAGGFVIAAGMLVLSLIYDKIKGRETLGGGDIKLFFVTGLYLGLGVNFLNLFLTCVVGLIFAAASAGKRAEKEDPQAIPLGPSIAISAWLCLLGGQAVWNWYLGFFR